MRGCGVGRAFGEYHSRDHARMRHHRRVEQSPHGRHQLFAVLDGVEGGQLVQAVVDGLVGRLRLDGESVQVGTSGRPGARRQRSSQPRAAPRRTAAEGLRAALRVIDRERKDSRRGPCGCGLRPRCPPRRWNPGTVELRSLQTSQISSAVHEYVSYESIPNQACAIWAARACASGSARPRLRFCPRTITPGRPTD